MKKLLLVMMLFALSSVGFSEITKEKEFPNFHQTDMVDVGVVLVSEVNEFNTLFYVAQKSFEKIEHGYMVLSESQISHRYQTSLRVSKVNTSHPVNRFINQHNIKMNKSDTQLTKNFNISEFACKDGTPVPLVFLPNVRLLAENLQIIRDTIDEPIYINSAYRHPAYNKAVGGGKKSQHLTCSASDIRCKSLTTVELYDKVRELIAAKKIHNGGLGRYKTFTHYDVRPKPARWGKKINA